MPWLRPQPQESWTKREQALWDQEVWTRIKFIAFDWTPTDVAAGGQNGYLLSAAPGADIQTSAAVGFRQGMGLKLTCPGVPFFGLTWDAACLANDTVNIWINNSSGVIQTPPAGTWTLFGVIV
jgi:hypothetical protein